MVRGYDQPLYILPFDHRGSFQSKMFGWKGDLTSAQIAEIAAAKRIIYDGFLAALDAGVPRQKAGILVDEQFGGEILRDAADRGIPFACPAEKSGQEEFDFEYGDAYEAHIETFQPTFCKVLGDITRTAIRCSISGRRLACRNCPTICRAASRVG